MQSTVQTERVTAAEKHAEYQQAVLANQPETARRLWWEYLDLVAAEMAEKKRPKASA